MTLLWHFKYLLVSCINHQAFTSPATHLVSCIIVRGEARVSAVEVLKGVLILKGGVRHIEVQGRRQDFRLGGLYPLPKLSPPLPSPSLPSLSLPRVRRFLPWPR